VRAATLFRLPSRLPPEPVEIGLAPRRDRPSHDAWAVVRMQFADALFDLREKGGPALGNQHDFGGSLNLAFPAVDRLHSGDYVDTGGESLLDQRASNSVGDGERRRSDVEGQILAHGKQRYRKSLALSM